LAESRRSPLVTSSTSSAFGLAAGFSRALIPEFPSLTVTFSQHGYLTLFSGSRLSFNAIKNPLRRASKAAG
jgi:hypothetical protein